jgi:hypothetical protein
MRKFEASRPIPTPGFPSDTPEFPHWQGATPAFCAVSPGCRRQYSGRGYEGGSNCGAYEGRGMRREHLGRPLREVCGTGIRLALPVCLGEPDEGAVLFIRVDREEEPAERNRTSCSRWCTPKLTVTRPSAVQPLWQFLSHCPCPRLPMDDPLLSLVLAREGLCALPFPSRSASKRSCERGNASPAALPLRGSPPRRSAGGRHPHRMPTSPPAEVPTPAAGYLSATGVPSTCGPLVHHRGATDDTGLPWSGASTGVSCRSWVKRISPRTKSGLPRYTSPHEAHILWAGG